MRAVQRFTDEQLAYASTLSPEQILQFLEDFRQLHAGREAGRSTPISLRVPDSLLRVFRHRAAAAGVPYQAQIKLLMEQWVRPEGA